MKVHLIKKKSIEEYAENNARIRPSLRIWLNILKFADWSIPNDIIASFGTADLLLNGSDRVVFNIAGNNYRIICKYTFGSKQVHLFVCWIGTHSEYDQICLKGKQFEVNNY